MTQARGYEPKTALTPEEKVKCGFLYLVRGIAQQDLAAAFSVNSGRVAEAIDNVRIAVDWPAGDKTDEH
jgi:hypothetical protein